MFMQSARMMIVVVFSGSEGLEVELRLNSVTWIESWDIKQGPGHDLLRWPNIRKLHVTLESGLVFLAWWASPCNSCAAARKHDGGPLRLAAQSFRMGCPGSPRSTRPSYAMGTSWPT